MKNIQCPECGYSITWLAKIFLTARWGRKCEDCGTRLFVSRTHTLTMSLVAIFAVYLITLAVPVDEFAHRIFLLLFVFVLVCRTQLVHLPLYTRPTQD